MLLAGVMKWSLEGTVPTCAGGTVPSPLRWLSPDLHQGEAGILFGNFKPRGVRDLQSLCLGRAFGQQIAGWMTQSFGPEPCKRLASGVPWWDPDRGVGRSKTWAQPLTPGAAPCSHLHAPSTAAPLRAWPEATEKAAAKAEYVLSP